MYHHRINLPVNVRERVLPLLQARLSDGADLSAQLKQAHWNVKGREFFQLHELFDKIHGEVENFVDLIAERIVALGGVADGRVQTTTKNSRLDPFPLDARGGDQHLEAVAAAIAKLGSSVRADADAAADAGDAATADLFTEVLREIDKQLWLVEAHLAA